MTQINPHLFLKRLVIVAHNGKIAYDENFHTGVNIIRGSNSSGKSTIANFIFYSLGGDYSNWTTAALKCREVFAELNVNGATLTLRRTISDNSTQPMSIHWGSFDQSKISVLDWQTYPYRQTDNKISFSKVIFNALNFPDVKTDNDSTITIHQVLRLLYIDQDTSTQSLFRAERFDPPLTRQTIAELLLGIYDDSLYSERIDLRNSQKEYESKKSQFDGIVKIYNQSGGELDIQKLEKERENTVNKIKEIEEAIADLRNKPRVNTTKRSPLKLETVQEKLLNEKDNVRKAKDRITQLEIDKFDSVQFINTLQRRILELDHSLVTRKVLGELPLTYCPQCLNPLALHTNVDHCSLCKEPLGEEAERTQAKRLKQEMELQVQESKSLLQKKNKEIETLNFAVQPYIESARNLQRELNNLLEENRTTRDEKIDELLIQKGGEVKKIDYLLEQINTAKTLSKLRSDIQELLSKITNIKQSISLKEGKQLNKQERAYLAIKEFTISLLRSDLERQGEFKSNSNVEIGFSKDTYSLDGSNNFSASSKVYFKNSVLYAIFFASLKLDFFRYPRFILCDNMEDKGMEKERTQNFQNQIVNLSNSMQEEHQIIFTTSMVSDQLNNGALCVGEYYDANHKTLDIE